MPPRTLNAAVASTSLGCFSAGAVASALALTQFPVFFDHDISGALIACAAVALPVALSVKFCLWWGRRWIDEDQVSFTKDGMTGFTKDGKTMFCP